VTSARLGTGAALAVSFAYARASVTITTRTAEALARTVDAVTAAGCRSAAIPHDAPDAKAAGEAVVAARRTVDLLDIFVGGRAASSGLKKLSRDGLDQ
jgi:NADP-dependent 3-hydroxy acid dehydrogenase YdfG